MSKESPGKKPEKDKSKRPSSFSVNRHGKRFNVNYKSKPKSK